MRALRLLSLVALVSAGIIGLATPAHAAVGPWRQVANGEDHTCAINTSDSLYCWGRNQHAQTGDGTTTTPRLSLKRVGALGVWSSISAGSYHTCGITTAKNLYCWGNNEHGQIGDGTTTTPRLSLYRVGATGVWNTVSAGTWHTCGITTTKSLYCWGHNQYAQIGDGTTNTPILRSPRIGAFGVWNSVSAGTYHTCGITNAKNLYCWGHNEWGQTGDGTTTTPRRGLHRVGAEGVWSSINTGAAHTCGITNAKNLYCWGNNEVAQIGDGTATSPRLSLYRVGAAGVWSSHSAGSFHTCGITAAKNLYCWGSNTEGQIGDGTTNTLPLALKRVGGTGVWNSIDAGGHHSCGITVAQNLYCWGHNNSGQVGDGGIQDPRLSLYRVT